MESSEPGDQLRRSVRDAEQGTDNPDTREARTVAPGGTANGHLGFGHTEFRAAMGLNAAEFGAGIRTLDPGRREGDSRPPETSPVPLGRLGRSGFLLLFMTIIFLAGLFIGASLVVNLSPDIIALLQKAASPSAVPAVINGHSSPMAATPQIGPATAVPAQAAAPQATTPEAPAPVEPAPAPMPKENPTAVVATSAADAPDPALATTRSTPLPTPPPDAAVPTVAATVTAAPGAPAPTTAPSVDTPGAATPPAEQSAAAKESLTLLTRGDELFATGDVASARLFYERASEAGNAKAALRLGETYDPFFLAQARLSGVLGNPAIAIGWYRRARELGANEAEILLRSVENR